MSRRLVGGKMSGGTEGECLLNVYLKYSAHLALFLFPREATPIDGITGLTLFAHWASSGCHTASSYFLGRLQSILRGPSRQ